MSRANNVHLHISVAWQVAAGVADALKAAQPFVTADRMCVMLGDNIVGGVLRDAVDAYRKQGMRAGLPASTIRQSNKRLGLTLNSRMASHTHNRVDIGLCFYYHNRASTD